MKIKSVRARVFEWKGKTVPPQGNFCSNAMDLVYSNTESMSTFRFHSWTVVEIETDDGIVGLKKLASTKFDLVITDINMPIMDGLKLVKRVRSDPVHKDTPIVIITTEGSNEDRQRALQLGANAYITKPIQAPQVIATVKELLRID